VVYDKLQVMHLDNLHALEYTFFGVQPWVLFLQQGIGTATYLQCSISGIVGKILRVAFGLDRVKFEITQR
jgi:hypothetical protein